MRQLAYLDPQDSLRLRIRGVYEPWETSVVQRDLKPGDTFVDVGAHIGYYTVMASELVGPAGRVYALEPAPANFKILMANTEGLANVLALRLAASWRPGERELAVSTSNSGDNRLDSADAEHVKVAVATIRLDGAVPDHASVSFVKIDTQGHEIEVLAGMAKILKASRNLKMLVEYAPALLSRAGHRPQELIEFLEAQGFELQSSRTYDFRNIDVAGRTHCNLYCTRRGGEA